MLLILLSFLMCWRLNLLFNRVSEVCFALQTSTTVVVSNANAQAAAPLVVKGYDVSGEVQSDGEPMKEVTFLLYSTTMVQEVSVFKGQSSAYMLLDARYKTQLATLR